MIKWGLPKIHHAATSPTLKGMSDHQMKKRQIYQTLVYGRTYQTKVLQDWTRNILHGPEIGKYIINGD